MLIGGYIGNNKEGLFLKGNQPKLEEREWWLDNKRTERYKKCLVKQSSYFLVEKNCQLWEPQVNKQINVKDRGGAFTGGLHHGQGVLLTNFILRSSSEASTIIPTFTEDEIKARGHKGFQHPGPNLSPALPGPCHIPIMSAAQTRVIKINIFVTIFCIRKSPIKSWV